MNDCTIREASLADAPAVADLLGQMGYPVLPGEMERRMQALISHPDYILLVAEMSGRVIGLAGAYMGRSLELSGKYGRLTGLAVHEEWRGRGVGKALAAQIENRLRDLGAALAVVVSATDRIHAHRFYRRLGYRESGVQFVKRLDRARARHES